MNPADRDEVTAAAQAVAEARRMVAAGNAQLAAAAVRYADVRTRADRSEPTSDLTGPGRTKPGEFVADELSLMLREQPWPIRCTLARTRRLTASLPTVWAAHQAGELDLEQVRMIDRVARRATAPATLAAVDEHAIDATLTAAARSLGTDDPRSQQQRRADLFTDLLLYTDRGPGDGESADVAPPAEASESRDTATDLPDPDSDPDGSDPPADEGTGPAAGGWLEVENIDPDTGELLGTHWQRLDPDGGPIGKPAGSTPDTWFPAFQRRPRTIRIGVVVPLTSLLGLDDSPGELTDRSAMVPAQTIRQLIAATLDADRDSRDQILFSRLLTDDGGRLLDVTEVGRYPSNTPRNG